MHGVYKEAVLPFSPREGFERGSARPQNTFEFWDLEMTYFCALLGDIVFVTKTDPVWVCLFR